MQVFLYLSAEVVTVSSGHHYIAQYEVGSFFAHGFEGAVGIEAADNFVDGRKQGLQVVGHFRIIVYHQQGLLLLPDALCVFQLILFFRLYRKRLVLFFFGEGTFFGGIGEVIHRQQQGEDGSASFGTVTGFQVAVMQQRQAAGVVQADAGSPVIGAFGLIVQLVVAFEYLLQLFLGDSVPAVGHGNFDVLRVDVFVGQRKETRSLFAGNDVEAQFHFPTVRSELQGV